MQLTVISDTHNYHDKLTIASTDILIHCGDYSTSGTKYEYDNFINWFGQQPAQYKILIYGNHDYFCVENSKYVIDEASKRKINFLWNETINIEGLSFYGSTWKYGTRHYSKNLEETVAFWNQIPNTTDILITHKPPHGIGDQLAATNSEAYKHIGCKYLLARVNIVQPKYHLFGHIHEGYGSYRNLLSTTEFINAACMDENYKLIHAPVIFNVKAA